MASRTTRRDQFPSTAKVSAAEGSKGFRHWTQCSASGEISVRPCFSAATCSLSRMPFGRPVSPMYAAPQSHTVLYTTPYLFSFGILSFTFTSLSLRVGLELFATLMLSGASALLIRSLTPFTYGRLTYVGVPVCSSACFFLCY